MQYFQPKRVNISDATTGNSADNNFPTVIGKGTLIIHNITAEDSGIYKCEVYDANQHTNFDQKLIKVLGKYLHPSLHLIQLHSFCTITNLLTINNNKP